MFGATGAATASVSSRQSTSMSSSSPYSAQLDDKDEDDEVIDLGRPRWVPFRGHTAASVQPLPVPSTIQSTTQAAFQGQPTLQAQDQSLSSPLSSSSPPVIATAGTATSMHSPKEDEDEDEEEEKPDLDQMTLGQIKAYVQTQNSKLNSKMKDVQRLNSKMKDVQTENKHLKAENQALRQQVEASLQSKSKPTAKRQRQHKYVVGTKFLKEYNDGWYLGTIVRYIASNGKYIVVYSDNDTERLSEHEINELFQQTMAALKKNSKNSTETAMLDLVYQETKVLKDFGKKHDGDCVGTVIKYEPTYDTYTIFYQNQDYKDELLRDEVLELNERYNN